MTTDNVFKIIAAGQASSLRIPSNYDHAAHVLWVFGMLCAQDKLNIDPYPVSSPFFLNRTVAEAMPDFFKKNSGGYPQ